MAINGIIFDLDGTLVDSAPDLHRAANRLMAETGRRDLTVREVTMMIGDGVPKLVERCFEATGDVPGAEALAAHTRRYLELYEPHAADLSAPFPGVIETLARLNGTYPMVVATNKPLAASMEILEKLGVAPYLAAIVAGDSIPGVKKPDPRHLQAALEKIDVGAGEAVMVGDNANDVAASRAAGVKVILMSYGYTKVPTAELGADLVIDAFAELPNAIARLG